MSRTNQFYPQLPGAYQEVYIYKNYIYIYNIMIFKLFNPLKASQVMAQEKVKLATRCHRGHRVGPDVGVLLELDPQRTHRCACDLT